MSLPYDMGNAGDLLKHGVLAEFVRWQCELGGQRLRFLDPFGGEPWGRPVPAVARRVRALPAGALRAAQSHVDNGRYYGSGIVARRTAEAAGGRGVRVLSGDTCPDRRDRLRACGLWMLHEAFPGIDVRSGRDRHDGYDAIGTIARSAGEDDLLLIDPFADGFLEQHARTVVPHMAAMAKRASVLLFVLNPDPSGRPGQRFDVILRNHLRGAWRMTCPPLPDNNGVRGESRYDAEVVLAARDLRRAERMRDIGVLRGRLTEFATQLGRVLGVSAQQLAPRRVGQ